MVTGGGGVVRAAQRSDKRVVAAGPGILRWSSTAPRTWPRPPATSWRARGSTTTSCCTCEKEILAEEAIASELLGELQRNDAVLLSADEAEALARAILTDYPGPEPRMNKDFVGKDPAVLAGLIGKRVPERPDSS